MSEDLPKAARNEFNMASLNRVFLIGNLTRDVEIRTTPKGTSIAQFGLAINRQFKDDSGTTRDETTFVDIEAWGKQADLTAKYLAKGSQCMIEGRLKLDQWEDKTSGQKRSRLKVIMDNVQFLDKRKDSAAVAPAAKTSPTNTDDDVPY